MTQYRRCEACKIEAQATTNARLWLDKYYSGQSEDKNEAKQLFLKEITETIQPDEAYSDYYSRWKAGLLKTGARIQEAQTNGRLSVNLGADSIIETSIALHYTYGVPYIPGSALKGLAAHFADRNLEDPRWQKDEEAHAFVFGRQDVGGNVVFFDALYVPNSGQNQQCLWKDVITVHHKEYYDKGNQPPADWDGTTVIPFLAANGRFLIALKGPPKWVDATYNILELALEKQGVGAKTSSGYGRLQFVSEGDLPQQQPNFPYAIEKRRLLNENASPGKTRGVVERVLRNGAFGFINPQRGGKQHFIHKSEMEEGVFLKEGQVLEYSLVLKEKGPQAREVKVLLDRREN